MIKDISLNVSTDGHRTYKRVLEGTDVGVLWSNVVEETGVPGGNHRPWAGDHYPATCRRRDQTRTTAVTGEGFTPALSRPLKFTFDHSALFSHNDWWVFIADRIDTNPLNTVQQGSSFGLRFFSFVKH